MALYSKKYLDFEGLGIVLDNIKNVYLGGIVAESFITADAYEVLDEAEKDKYTLVSDGGKHNGEYRKVANVREYVDDTVNALDLTEVGGAGKVITTLSQENGKVSATAIDLASGAVSRKVAGGISGTTVETALVELQSKIDASNAAQKSYKLVKANITDENVKEAWKIQVAAGDGEYTDIEGSSVIKIYKDAQIHRIYLGTSGDTINATTGVITEKANATETDKQSLNYAYIKPDGKYELVKIDVSKFLKEAEFKNGLEVAANGVVSVKIDDASESFLSVSENGVKLSGVQNAINTTIDSLAGEVTSNTVAGVATKVSTSKGKVSAVEVTVADNAVTAGGVNNNRTLTAANDSAVIKGNALAAIVQHIKEVVSDNTAGLAVKADGDTYVSAKIAGDDNKKVVVKANVSDITLTKDNGADTTMSGVATTLVSGGEVATKVSTFVNNRIREEVAKLDATVSSDDSAVATVEVIETNGKIADVVVTNVSAGVSAGGNAGARTLTADTGTGAVTGSDIATIKSYIDNMVGDTNGSFVAITETEITSLFN